MAGITWWTGREWRPQALRAWPRGKSVVYIGDERRAGLEAMRDAGNPETRKDGG